jgi:hypothetical protein
VDTTHPCAVDGTDLKPSWIESTYLLLQFVCVGKGVVSKIHVALESKRELAVNKKSGGSWFVVEPMEYGLEWIQALVKGKHCFRGETIVVYRHLLWVSHAFRTGTEGVSDADCGRVGVSADNSEIGKFIFNDDHDQKNSKNGDNAATEQQQKPNKKIMRVVFTELSNSSHGMMRGEGD